MFKETHPILGTRDIQRAIAFYTQRFSRTSRCGEEKGQKIDVAAAPTHVDPHIAAVGPAELGKMPYEFPEQRLTFWIGRGITHEHADSPNSVRLLRAPLAAIRLPHQQFF